MVKIYTTNSCSSCKKALKWLKDNNIPYKEVNFFHVPLTKDDIMLMLENSLNGFEDLISKRSKPFIESGIDFESLSVNDLIEFILANPSVLKRPIIIEDTKMQVGYNDEEIRTFIPPEVRRQWVCKKMQDCNECIQGFTDDEDGVCY